MKKTRPYKRRLPKVDKPSGFVLTLGFISQSTNDVLSRIRLQSIATVGTELVVNDLATDFNGICRVGYPPNASQLRVFVLETNYAAPSLCWDLSPGECAPTNLVVRLIPVDDYSPWRDGGDYSPAKPAPRRAPDPRPAPPRPQYPAKRNEPTVLQPYRPESSLPAPRNYPANLFPLWFDVPAYQPPPWEIAGYNPRLNLITHYRFNFTLDLFFVTKIL